MARGIFKLVTPPKRRKANMLSYVHWLKQLDKECFAEKRPIWGEPREFIKGWRPSLIGESNARILVATVLGYRSFTIDARMEDILNTGKVIENLWIDKFNNMGILEACNVPMPPPTSDVTISGYADAIIQRNDELVVVELKTIAPWGYDNLPRPYVHKDNYDLLTRLRGALHDRVNKYMKQLQVYLHELGMENGMLMFVNKGTQEYKIYDVQYNAKAVEALYGWLRKMEVFWGLGVIPPWTGKENSKDLLAQYKPHESVPYDEMKEWVIANEKN